MNDNKSIRTALDYDTSRRKLLDFIADKKNEIMVLSTSANDIVMSRNVLIVNKDLDMYFFTWAYSRKCGQIKINPRISLCKDKIGIEGIARLIGPMFAPEQADILDLFAAREPLAVKRWESKPDMEIYHIVPSFACIDGYTESNDDFLEYIDLEHKTAYKETWACG